MEVHKSGLIHRFINTLSTTKQVLIHKLLTPEQNRGLERAGDCVPRFGP